MTLSDQREILVRLGRSDVNMLNYKGFPLDSMIRELDFESAVYTLLTGHTEIPVSALHFSRPPIKHNVGTDYDVEISVQGRQLMVFDKHPGKSNVWWELSPGGRVSSYFRPFRYHVTNASFVPSRMTLYPKLHVFEPLCSNMTHPKTLSPPILFLAFFLSCPPSCPSRSNSRESSGWPFSAPS
jgi:hypothetical protein